MELLILVFGGVVAGFVNVLAGGGGLITMTLLVLIGLPETSANGTARVAIVAQGLTALWRFERGGAVDWRGALPLLPPVLIGAIAGAVVGTQLSGSSFRMMLGVAALLAGAIVAVDLPQRLGRRTPSKRSAPLALALLACGFYGGMLQAGAGYLFLASLTLLGGLQLVPANVFKVLLVTAYMPVVIAVFAQGGYIEPRYAAALVIGQAIGAFIAAGMTLKRGEKLIRGVLAMSLVAAALALLLDGRG